MLVGRKAIFKTLGQSLKREVHKEGREAMVSHKCRILYSYLLLLIILTIVINPSLLYQIIQTTTRFQHNRQMRHKT